MSTSRQSLYKSYVYIGFLVVVPALATIYALYQAYHGNVSTFNVVFCLAAGAIIELGVTIGYHRMLVHRSFVPHPAIRAVFLALGSMALQGPAISWAAVHIKHHAYSDDDGDPHSPTVLGFIHAHFEWMMEMSFEDVHAIRDRFGKRFENDRMVQFFDKTFHIWTIVGLLIPFLVGGWECLLWGGLVRIFLTSHVTWCVNSWCHVFGGRMFTTKDQSRNSMLIGIFAMGEGWHNNHHAFPTSAFHGMKWWQIDVSAYIIRVLERLHLVRDVVRIPQEKLQQRLNTAIDSVSRSVHDVATSATELASAARHSAGEAAQNAKHKIEESADALAHHAENLKDSAMQKADDIVSEVENVILTKESVARA